MLLLNKLALNFWTIFNTSKSVSKESPTKNCWVDVKPLPVYHTPPPSVIKVESIEPVDPTPKLAVVHSVATVVLFLYLQLAPFELVGKLEYLPVPSSQDWDIVNNSKFKVDIKFLGSAAVNCKLAVAILLKLLWPIIFL